MRFFEPDYQKQTAKMKFEIKFSTFFCSGNRPIMKNAEKLHSVQLRAWSEVFSQDIAKTDFK